MACDCKCGQVLQAELAELKQRRQELRESVAILAQALAQVFGSSYQ